MALTSRQVYFGAGGTDDEHEPEKVEIVEYLEEREAALDATSEALSKRIEAAGQGYRVAESWAVLSGEAGTVELQPAEVSRDDTGTHVDPVTGLTVPNTGQYRWSDDPAGWRRVGDLVVADGALAGKDTVGTPDIDPGAVLPSRLSVRDWSNIYPDPNMEDLSLYGGDLLERNATTAARVSEYFIRTEATASATSHTSAMWPVEPGQWYLHSHRVGRTQVGTVTASVAVQFYSNFAANVPIGAPIPLGAPYTGTGSVVRSQAMQASPNAVRARFAYTKHAGDAPSRAIWSEPIVRRMVDDFFLVDDPIGRLRAYLLATAPAPTDIGLSSNSIDETAEPGDVVALLSLTTEAPSGQPIYTLINDAGGKYGLDGDRIIVAGALSKGADVIRVRAQNWIGHPAIEREKVIFVEDETFSPAALESAVFVIDNSSVSGYWTNEAGSMPASMNDAVQNVSDAAGGANFFSTTNVDRRPRLRTDGSGKIFLHNNLENAIAQRLVSDAPVLPDSTDWFFGVACMAEADEFLAIFAQRTLGDGTDYDDDGNFQIQLHSNWSSTGNPQVQNPDRVIAYVDSAAGGFSLAPSGPGQGQPRNGWIETDVPVVISVKSRAGALGCEFRVNGILYDRFTNTVNARQAAAWILHNTSDPTQANSRLYGMVCLDGSESDAEIAATERWLMKSAAVSIGYPVGELPRLWSPRAIVIDAATGAQLAARNPDERASPASMGKLMTMFVAFRSLGFIDESAETALASTLTVTEGDRAIANPREDLLVGDVISLESALTLAAVSSDNWAARAVARVFGSLFLDDDGETGYSEIEARSRFVEEMNLANSAAGLDGSAEWTNPVGGSTARVSARHCALLMAKLVVDFPLAEMMLSVADCEVTVTGSNARTFTAPTTNSILARGETWMGASKTGTNTSAGACNVWMWEIDGNPVVGCTMGAPDDGGRFSDVQAVKSVVERDWIYVDGRPAPTR